MYCIVLDRDICDDHGHSININVSQSSTCDFPIWTSEGWKDGLKSVNFESLHSYDIFDLLVNSLVQLQSTNNLPSLKSIKLFGFSAGAQVILRHAIFPHYDKRPNKDKNGDGPTISYVISDPSTYLYFNEMRVPVSVPLDSDKHVGIVTLPLAAPVIPNESWIPDFWKVGEGDITHWI